MDTIDRRRFLKSAGWGLAAPWTAKRRRREALPGMNGEQVEGLTPQFELGMASYTFRAFGLDQTLAWTARLGLRRIALKSFHLPLESRPAQIRAVAAKVRDAGLVLYGGGVIYMRTESETRQAFEYAKAAGMAVMIGVPNHELLPLVEKLVPEYDLRLAIHNHGPGDKLFPTPESVFDKVRDLDPRIGLGIDVGHTRRAGADPAADAERFASRLLDVHIKDVTAPTAAGETVEIGRGVVDIPKFLKALIRVGYAVTVSLEYEKDEKDPYPGAAESIGYLRGVLAAL
jgi:sugar phosphate isomerase/epimerase